MTGLSAYTTTSSRTGGTAQPESGQKRVALGQPNEEPQRALLEGLVGEVLHQRRGHLIGFSFILHLEVQDLEHPRASQVEAQRLARGLDEANDLSVLFGDVDQRLLG